MSTERVFKHIKSVFNVRKGRAGHDSIRKRVHTSSRIDGIHMCQLIAAMLIASVGLNVDSTEAVIGAMLICPIMGSVIAIAYAVASADMKLLRDALGGLAIQVGVCIVTSTIYFALSPLAVQTDELLANSNPTIWDVIVALVGGFAGALGLSRKQEPATLISGVAVATALMPPLCAVGYGLATRELPLAASALYEFLVNVVYISFGAQLVFVLLRVPLAADLDGDGWVTEEEDAKAERRSRRIRVQLVVGSILFALPCIFFSVRMVHQTIAENGTLLEIHDAYETEMTARELDVICPSFVDYRVGAEDSYDFDDDALTQRVVATVETSRELSDRTKDQIESLIMLNASTVDEITFEVVDPELASDE